MRRATILGVLCLTISAAAAAQPFASGEIVVVGRRVSDSHGVISVFSPSGVSSRNIRDVAVGDWFEAAFNRSGFLYVPSGAVFIFDQNGNEVGTLPQELGAAADPIAFASDGRTFVVWDVNHLVEFDVANTRVRSYTLPGVVTSIDFGRDPCTLYFTTTILPVTFESAVGRVNVCTAAPLAPQYLRTYSGLPTADAQEVRVLPNGQLLVARWLAGVELLDSSGALVRTFATPATELAFAPDGLSFYAGLGTAPVQRIDLANGAVLQTIATGINVRGLAVVGDPRAAFASASDVPLLAPSTLLALAIGLALAATSALRSRM